MRASTLDIMQCPRCTGILKSKNEAVDGKLTEGGLVCTGCGALYAIRSGVVQFASKEQVKDIYPEMEEQGRTGARLYDVFLAHFLDILGVEADAARAAYLDHIKLPPGARILDVGIGTGGNFVHLLQRLPDLELFGVDISAEMLRQCRRKLAKLDKAIDLTVGFAEHLPYQSNTFDAVMHVGAINEFKDPAAALTEMTRVAAPGAPIVVADEWLTEENMNTTMGKSLIQAFPSLPPRSSPPEAAVPEGMEEVAVDSIWGGYGFCLRFRKPLSPA